MQHKYLAIFTVLFSAVLNAQFNYTPTDLSDPVYFQDSIIIYKADTILLGTKAFFIDGQLNDQEAALFPYVFNSVNEAVKHLVAGTEDEPMIMYIAPYVYWIDNPDDPEIRTPESGGTPYGLTIDCPWLTFYGLNDHPENIVLACNRGQTLGAIGNFTMFKILGDGIRSENITFGNYCNVDLVYPLKPELNRKKRATPIVQAQLIHCNGDKIIARNTHFISRLNLCNFVGAKRILFDRCHFESTDDALCGSGVYLNSTFEFYSSKPFYHTRGTGAVFLNCDIHSYTSGSQYFTKASGQLAVIDTRINGENVENISWQMVQPVATKNYQYNVSLNGNEILIGENSSANTVDLKNKSVLNAYRFLHADSIIYNTYNLLQGTDDWDPMDIKPIVVETEKTMHQALTKLPTQIKIVDAPMVLETKKDKGKIEIKAFRFGNIETTIKSITWEVHESDRKYVKIIPSKNGQYCTIIPNNHENVSQQVTILAKDNSGLEAAVAINILPSILPAPKLSGTPKIKQLEDESLTLEYKLKSKYKDESIISWYRCDDPKGLHKIKVADSRFNEPFKTYPLTSGDISYFIVASIQPKDQRSEAGSPVFIIKSKFIRESDIKTHARELETDFKNIAIENQPVVLPGFWTFKPFENDASTSHDAWVFEKGYNGALNDTGLTQSGRSGKMFYTPVGKNFTDMSLKLHIVPFKTAGQGFSVANMYMDVVIKFNAKSLSGYGLRLIRTTNYSNTVEAFFVEYKNGEVIPISKAVPISCYRGNVNLALEVQDNVLTATLNSDQAYPHKTNPDVVQTDLMMGVTIEENNLGAFGIIYNGGAKAIIKNCKATWK